MNPNEALKLAKQVMDQALAERRRNEDLLRSIGPAIVEALTPALNKIAKTAENSYETKAFDDNRRNRELISMVGPAVADSIKSLLSKVETLTDKNADILKSAVHGLKVEVNPEFKMPEVKVPTINVPKPEVTVNVPKITVPTPQVTFDMARLKMPDIKMPDEMGVKGWVGFMGYDRKMLNDPLPVQLRDADGNPVKLFENLTTLMTQGGGGGAGFPMAAFDVTTQSIRVAGSFQVTGSNASSQLIDSSAAPYTIANPFPVQVVSGGTATSAVNLVDSSGVAYSGSNPLPTTASVTLSAATGQGDEASALRVVQAGNSASSVSATQVGTWNIGTVTTVTGVTNTVNVRLDTADGNVSASNPFPVTLVSGTISSTKAQIGNSDGDFTIANPLPIRISGAAASTYAEIMNPDGRVKVELPSGSSGLTDTELRASHLDVDQVSGSIWSTSVVGTAVVSVLDIFGSVSASLVNPDGRLKVELPSGASGLTDTELRATAVPFAQVSGANWSVYATNPVDNGDSATALRVVIAGNSASSVSATQVGTWNIGTVTTVTGITNSLAASLVDSSGVQYSGSNPVPIGDAGGSLTVDGTVAVSGITGTVATGLTDSSGVQYSGSNPVPVTWVSGAGVSTTVNIGDSTGVGYSGSNPLPIYIVSGSGNSTISVGPVLHDAVDDGAAPQKVGGTAMTTNPTAVSGGDVVRFVGDDIGRQLIRPVQVRDLISTAYATLNTNSETTLRAGVASTFLDLIHIMGTNTSTNAVYVDIYTGAGGAVMQTIGIPAGGTAGLAGSVPIPASEAAQAWYVKLNTTAHSDVSNTTVLLSALFSQEV